MSHPVRVRWQIVSDDGCSAGTEENQQEFDSTSQINKPVQGIMRRRIGFWLAVGALALILWRICGIAPSQPVSVGPAIDVTAVTDSAPTAPLPVGNQEIMAVDLRKGMVWVRVRQQTEDAKGPIRHSLFFAQADGGWQPAAPQPGFWGAAWQQSGEFFVFYFRQRDRAAVEDALPLLDQRYPLLRRWLGLSALPDGKKVRVTVRGPEPDPPTGAARSEGVSVPSPFLLSLPESVSDAEALICSVLLPLIDQSIAEALAPAPDLNRWQPTPELVRGLGLWGRWETC